MSTYNRLIIFYKYKSQNNYLICHAITYNRLIIFYKYKSQNNYLNSQQLLINY